MAHEMRNPLATIRGFIQIFPDESGDPEFRREFSVNVLREIDRLTRLTDDLLNLAKPSGMVLQPVEGGQPLAEVHLFLKEKLQKHGIETRLDLPEAPLFIPMDRNRIKQVLLNLILNAIEAMPSGGRLGLSLRSGREHLESSDRDDPFAVYEVADSGIGVPADKLERIFDPFFTTKDSGGSGAFGFPSDRGRTPGIFAGRERAGRARLSASSCP
jgi:signal transduction histidine kinase